MSVEADESYEVYIATDRLSQLRLGDPIGMEADPYDMHDLANYLTTSRDRLDQARGVAESLRHDETLHRLAMAAVFVLEDCHEALWRIGGPEQQSRQGRTPPRRS